MRIFDLDPRKKQYFDALKGVARPVSSVKTGTLTMATVKAAALVAFKVAALAALVGGAVLASDYLDVREAERMRDQVLKDLNQERIFDRDNAEAMASFASRNKGGYYVVKIEGKDIYSVRSAEHFYDTGNIRTGIAYSDFRHGGKSEEHAPLKIVGVQYRDATSASKALAAMVDASTLKKPPLAGGKIAKMGGKWVTIDDFGAVDFSVF